MASGEAGPSREPRRRLDGAKDQAITAAVVDVLARLGLSGFTMDEVALTAGVGKAAIYRRWSSRTDLLARYTISHVTCSLTGGPLGCGFWPAGPVAEPRLRRPRVRHVPAPVHHASSLAVIERSDGRGGPLWPLDVPGAHGEEGRIGMSADTPGPASRV